MGASNNAQGQNAGARQQINQQTTQALQRLMMYLGQNPSAPPGAGFMPGAGGMPGPAAPGGASPSAGPTPQGSIGSIAPQSAVTQPGMGGVSPQMTGQRTPVQGSPMQIPPQLLAQFFGPRGGQ
jgi:hypothetical protein